MRRASSAGFTLIELMIVVVIAAIMATLGLPSFRSFVEGQRIKTAAGDFAQAVLYARSEAIKRNGEVKVIAAGGGWADGWSVTVTNGGVVVSTQAAYPGINFVTSPAANEISYLGNGRLGSVATTLTVSGNASAAKRCVGFDLSGLPRSLQGGQCP